MIVQIVDVVNLTAFESENNPPVSRYVDGMEAFQLARQWMQPRSGRADVVQ